MWVTRRSLVTRLRKMMLEELQRRNLSKLTAECYLRAVEEFALFYKRPPDQLGPEQIRQYQAHLFTDRKLDANTVAQHLSALRFFFVKTLKRNWSVEETPRSEEHTSELQSPCNLVCRLLLEKKDFRRMTSAGRGGRGSREPIGRDSGHAGSRAVGASENVA